MTYFLLFLIISDNLLEQILTKQYNIKAKTSNVALFSAVSCFFALLFFLFNSHRKFDFDFALLPYSLAFAAAFGTVIASQTLAIKTGPLSVTALFSSYSLLIPTFYGIIFLNDSVSTTLYIGLVLLIISLFLINRRQNESLKFSPLWIVYVLLTFVSNGMCSTVQKMQQIRFGGAYKNELMIIALGTITPILFILGLLKKGNKKEMLVPTIKYAAVKGFSNGIMNYLVMFISALMPSAVLYPSISAGSVALTFIVSRIFYKEKSTPVQTLGYILGIASVILLNL